MTAVGFDQLTASPSPQSRTLLRHGNTVVFQENDFESAADVSIAIDHCRISSFHDNFSKLVQTSCHRIAQLDNQLCHVVAGRRLAANQDSAGHEIATWVCLDT